MSILFPKLHFGENWVKIMGVCRKQRDLESFALCCATNVAETTSVLLSYPVSIREPDSRARQLVKQRVDHHFIDLPFLLKLSRC